MDEASRHGSTLASASIQAPTRRDTGTLGSIRAFPSSFVMPVLRLAIARGGSPILRRSFQHSSTVQSRDFSSLRLARPARYHSGLACPRHVQISDLKSMPITRPCTNCRATYLAIHSHLGHARCCLSSSCSRCCHSMFSPERTKPLPMSSHQTSVRNAIQCLSASIQTRCIPVMSAECVP